MKSLKPFIIIILGIALAYLYTWPQWNKMAALRVHELELSQALTKAQELTVIRDRLIAQYDTISPADTEKIKKVVPETFDPVKLVADLNSVATTYGMVVRDVKISPQKAPETNGVIQTAPPVEIYKKNTVSFGVQGTYRNFIAFLGDLEKSLQLLDIEKIEVDSGQKTTKDAVNTSLNFKIFLHTYSIQ